MVSLNFHTKVKDTNTTRILSIFPKHLPWVTKVKRYKSEILAPQCSILPPLAYRTSKDNFKPVAVNN